VPAFESTIGIIPPFLCPDPEEDSHESTKPDETDTLLLPSVS
jgi:hypothetical protein